MPPALDFPASPTVGQKYPAPPVTGVPVYSWDGEKWTTSGGAIGSTGASDAIPQPDTGTGAAGSSTLWSRGDHAHPLPPTDLTRAPIASPTFTGDPKAPTPAAGDNDTSLATTAFVSGAISTAVGGIPGAPSAVVRYDIAQTLTAPQQQQARQNIGSPAANLIINGDFRVNQVGYVSAAVLTAGAYGHDQWKAGASGGDYSFTQLKSSTQITIASGKSLIQPIEDANVVGGSYVLSWTGTAQARAGVNTLTPSGSYAGSPLLITGQTAGTVMSIEFNTGTLGTVKLESGANATPFVMRSYDQELVTCQRYFKWQGMNMQFYSAGTTVQHGFPIIFSPTMRAAPTMGAFVADPNTTQQSTNANSAGVAFATSAGAFMYFAANATGNATFTGYRCAADARL